MILDKKKIILAISGGIAAYKTVDLASQLKKLGADVHVVCTENALKFVSKLSLQTMTGNPVHEKQFVFEEGDDDVIASEAKSNGSPQPFGLSDDGIASDCEVKIDHIVLADEADLVLIAPATANTIGKMAHGISDNLITDFSLATKAPVVIAPAMNTNMWEHKAVKKNIDFLKNELGYHFVEPEHGELACGHVGQGRLAEHETIIDKLCLVLAENLEEKILSGKKVIVTAGGTREKIDPVRFIGNYSSGKMGFALADAAYTAGAEVILISTIEVDKSYKVVNVESAQEMQNAIESEFKGSDILIMAAAVADYRAADYSNEKIKKNENDLEIKLSKTADILKELSKENQIIVGFALETNDLIENAKKKLADKNLDLIVANETSAFGNDQNELYLISKNGKVSEQIKDSKLNLAKIILNEVSNLLKEKVNT